MLMTMMTTTVVQTMSMIYVAGLQIQTMSMVSVIAAIFVSITLSAAIVVAVVCCRHTGSAERRRRRPWLPRRGRGYAATADVVACEMEEFDAASFDQCSLSTTVDDVRRSQQLPLCNDDRPELPSTSWPTLPTSRRSYDSVSTPSACRLLKSDNEDAGSTDGGGDDVARSGDGSFQSLGDDLRPLHDNEDSSSTSTNETAFSDDAQPAPASSLQHLQTGYPPDSSLESGHI